MTRLSDRNDDVLLVTCRVCGKPVVRNDLESQEDYGEQLVIKRSEINDPDIRSSAVGTASVGYCSDKCLDDPKVEAEMRQRIGMLSRKIGIGLEDVEEPEP